MKGNDRLSIANIRLRALPQVDGWSYHRLPILLVLPEWAALPSLLVPMAYDSVEKLIGLLAGTEDPEHPENALLVAELGDPRSTTSQLREHIHVQTELLLQAPPGDMALDIEHGLAQALTATRRTMQAVSHSAAHVPHATADDVGAVIEVLRMQPDALRTKAARDAAVTASVANIRRQNPATRIADEAAFNAAVGQWMKAHVQSVDMLLRRK